MARSGSGTSAGPPRTVDSRSFRSTPCRRLRRHRRRTGGASSPRATARASSGAGPSTTATGCRCRPRPPTSSIPTTPTGALKYLTTISRIGKRRAKQLVDRHGADRAGRLDADPESAFGSLPRMSERVGDGCGGVVARAARAARPLRPARPHGAGWLAAPLHERHGPGAVGIVRSDPYRLTEEHGIGFDDRRRDRPRPRRRRGLPGRYRAALVHVLQAAERRGGHTLPARRPPAARRLRAGRPAAGRAARGPRRDPTRSRSRTVARQLPATWEAEAALADDFAGLAGAAAPAPDWLDGAIDEVLGTAAGDGEDGEAAAPTGATPEQRAAIEAAFERRLSVITGGPGTGKTTLVATIAALRRARRPDAARCARRPAAPRAGSRRRPATPATTIHRLLEWIPRRAAARPELSDRVRPAGRRRVEHAQPRRRADAVRRRRRRHRRGDGRRRRPAAADRRRQAVRRPDRLGAASRSPG